VYDAVLWNLNRTAGTATFCLCGTGAVHSGSVFGSGSNIICNKKVEEVKKIINEMATFWGITLKKARFCTIYLTNCAKYGLAALPDWIWNRK
jgi:hypothetical protein